jgi:uncharacterized membrane protein YjjB (DUF3815 family)
MPKIEAKNKIKQPKGKKEVITMSTTLLAALLVGIAGTMLMRISKSKTIRMLIGIPAIIAMGVLVIMSS